MKKLLVSLAVFGFSFAAVASEEFAKYDTDKNGVISVEEAQQSEALLLQFKELDTDSNGELSEEEFSKFVG